MFNEVREVRPKFFSDLWESVKKKKRMQVIILGYYAKLINFNIISQNYRCSYFKKITLKKELVNFLLLILFVTESWI